MDRGIFATVRVDNEKICEYNEIECISLSTNITLLYSNKKYTSSQKKGDFA